MKVGFTGTQQGMTLAQNMAFRHLISGCHGDFHHGDCVGADAEAHDLARLCWFKIIIHPPTNSSKRAWKEGDETRPCSPYLVRNKHIVDESEWLIATPKEDTNQLRSGTWSTVRYAMKKKRDVTIILASGVLQCR